VRLVCILSNEKNSFLTGAGISNESGIQTFRDNDSLWEGHDVMQVASPEGFEENPELMLDFTINVEGNCYKLYLIEHTLI